MKSVKEFIEYQNIFDLEAKPKSRKRKLILILFYWVYLTRETSL